MSTIRNKTVKLNGKSKLNVNVETYMSAQEMVEHSKTRKITDSRFHDKTQSGQCRKDWDGVDSYEEALDLLKTGYQPTVEALGKAIKASKNGVQKRIQFENNVHGFAPVVPLALKGVPNSMINMTMKPIKCKVIDVYYDMVMSSSTDPETIIKNGQKVLGAILDLEKQGYRFNLYAVQTYSESDSVDMVCVKIKSSDKPFDLKRMSFPLTHPAFFRTIGFDWYSKCPVAKYRYGYGRAIAYDLDAKQKKVFAEQLFGEGAIYISCAQISAKDHDELKEVFTSAEN